MSRLGLVRAIHMRMTLPREKLGLLECMLLTAINDLNAIQALDSTNYDN